MPYDQNLSMDQLVQPDRVHKACYADDGFRIKLQRVDIVNAEGPFECVLQFWL